MRWELEIGGSMRSVRLSRRDQGVIVDGGGLRLEAGISMPDPETVVIELAGARHVCRAVVRERTVDVDVDGVLVSMPHRDPREAALDRLRHGASASHGEVIETSMPGKVVAVLVAIGDLVAKGQGVAVVEAMKMENELRARRGGRVTEILARAGQPVDAGARLLVLEDPS
jgi:biotin carboxyl carrier protein